MTEAWILLVTIWFSGDMNSYQVDFMKKVDCENAKFAIQKDWGEVNQQYLDSDGTRYYDPPVISAVCVKDSWEEIYD